MVKKKTAKVTSLIFFLVVICIALLQIDDYSSVGIFIGCGLNGRLLYPFCHANLLHALLNAWCLLSAVFIYDISLSRIILAYIIAVSVPSFFLSTIPTVGLSGVVFVLFGSLSFEVERKVYYQLCMAVYLVIGFLFPGINAWLHLYCYLAGVAMALFNKPIKIG